MGAAPAGGGGAFDFTDDVEGFSGAPRRGEGPCAGLRDLEVRMEIQALWNRIHDLEMEVRGLEQVLAWVIMLVQFR